MKKNVNEEKSLPPFFVLASLHIINLNMDRISFNEIYYSEHNRT
jgi:hypothetical protein